MLDRLQDVVFVRDRFGEAAFGDVRRQRQARDDRFFLDAQRLVEAAQQECAEAGGERRARAAFDVGDFLQAHARQGVDLVGVDTQGGERQR